MRFVPSRLHDDDLPGRLESEHSEFTFPRIVYVDRDDPWQWPTVTIMDVVSFLALLTVGGVVFLYDVKGSIICLSFGFLLILNLKNMKAHHDALCTKEDPGPGIR